MNTLFYQINLLESAVIKIEFVKSKILGLILGSLSGLIVFIAGLSQFSYPSDNQIKLEALFRLEAPLRVTYQNYQKSAGFLNKITKDHPVILGSSDLQSAFNYDQDTLQYWEYFQRYQTQQNPIFIGSGNAQWLFNAILLGSESIHLKSKIVILFSPQWFLKNDSGMNVGQIRQHISEEQILLAIKKNDRDIQEKIIKILYKRGFQDNFLLNFSSQFLFSPLSQLKLLVREKQDDLLFSQFVSEYQSTKIKIELQNKRIYPIPDESQLLKIKQNYETLLPQLSNSNSFGIYDYYFENYVKDSLDKVKKDNGEYLSLESSEWEDFQLALDIIKKKKYQVLVIIPPVHKKLYEQLGYKFNNIEQFYQKVDQCLKEAGVQSLNFGQKSDEKYWLRDAMHFGWNVHLEGLRGLNEFLGIY